MATDAERNAAIQALVRKVKEDPSLREDPRVAAKLREYASWKMAQQTEPNRAPEPKADLSAFSPEQIQVLEQAGQMIARNPVGPAPAARAGRVPTAPRVGGGAFGIDAGQIGNLQAEVATSDDPSQLRAQAYGQGIDIYSGTMDSPQDRFWQRANLGLAAQFTNAPLLQASILEKSARKRIDEAGVPYPAGAPVVGADPNTGAIMMLRPIGQRDIDRGDSPENRGKLRWTLVNPEGFDLGDVGEFLPQILEAGAGGVGAGVGLAVSKNPVVANTVGASLAGYIGSLTAPAKQQILEAINPGASELIRQGMDPNQLLTDTLWGIGGELGGAMLIGAVDSARRAGRFVDPDDASAIVEEISTIRETFEELEEVTGVSLEPSSALVAAAGGIGSGTAGGAALATRARVATGRLGAKAAQDVAAQNLALRTRIAAGFTDMTNRAVTQSDPAVITEMTKRNGILAPEGTPVADLVQRRIAEPVAASDEALEQAARAERAARDAVIEDVDSAFYPAAQWRTEQGLQRMQANRDALWEDFMSYVEGQELLVSNRPGSPVRTALDEIGEEGQRALMASAAADQQRFLTDLAELQGDVLPSVDMYRLLKELEVRRTPRSAASVDRLVQAIEEQLGDERNWRSVGESGRLTAVRARGREALKRFGAAAKATEAYKELSESTVIRNLTARNAEDEFVNLPDTVRNEILRSPEAMRDVLRTTEFDPGVKAGFAGELKRMYETAAYAGGEFSRTAHRDFMRRWNGVLEQVLDADDLAAISNVETMGLAVNRAKAKAGRVREAFKEAFGPIWNPGKGVGFENVIQEAMSTKAVSSNQLRRLMSRVSRADPQLATQLRAEMAQWMSGQAINGRALRGSDPFNRMLNTHEAKITAVMGKPYVDNLKKVARALEVTELGEVAGRAQDPVSGTVFRQMTNVLFGPLSKQGRILNNMNQFMRRTNAKNALRIMSDPALLRQYVQLAEMTPTSFGFQVGLANLGLQGLAKEQGIPVLSPAEIQALGAQMQFTNTREFNRLLEAVD
jgi:hypothetical protein